MIATAPVTAVRVERFAGETLRAREVILAMQAAAPRSTPEPWLLLWGPGAPDRWPLMRRTMRHGGHVIALDLAYWDRDQKFRVSFDAAHPQAWVLRQSWPASRLEADGIVLDAVWNPDGPVIIAGLGRKARVQYGDRVAVWEQQMISACQARGWRVCYRPKQVEAPVPYGLPVVRGPIAAVLTGASLVVTWHSNVAVDAIRQGIPVVCQDGAAAAVCPSVLPDYPHPLDEATRRTFLQNLAWFQWRASEAPACWAWIREVLA